MADDLDFETVEKLLAQPSSSSPNETHTTKPSPSPPSSQPPTQPPSTPPTQVQTKSSSHKTHKHKRHRSRSSSHHSHTRRHKHSSRHRSTSRHNLRRSHSTHSSRRHSRRSPRSHRHRSPTPKRKSGTPPRHKTRSISPPRHKTRSISPPSRSRLYSPPSINTTPITPIDDKLDEETKRRKELEESHRDDLTVLILNLNLKATEKDIYDFFAEHAGKVRDIQCIKDQRSGRAKGVAYVEFFTQEAVLKALALNEQLLKGQPIKVQASQAEKNRAAKAAKIQQTEATDGPMKLFVGGLVDVLSNITPEQLKDILVPFGEIISVDIQRDPYTGRSKGFAFVMFRHTSEAREAIKALNNFELRGCTLKVGLANDTHKSGTLDEGTHSTNHTQNRDYIDNYDSDRLDDDGGGLLSGVGSKLLLMQKLQRGNELPSVFNNLNTQQPQLSIYTQQQLPLHTQQIQQTLHPQQLQQQLLQQQQMLHTQQFQDPSLIIAEQQARLIAGHVKNGLGIDNQLNTHTHTPITSNIVIRNMFNINDPSIKDDPDFFIDLIDEANSECGKYGNVVCVYIQQKNDKLDGTVWVRFANNEQAHKASNALNGRYFAENVIKVEYVNDQQWNAYCQ